MLRQIRLDRPELIDLLCMPDTQHARGGAGTVHHIAFRTPDDASQRACREQLVKLGFNVSPVMDRTLGAFSYRMLLQPDVALHAVAHDCGGTMNSRNVEFDKAKLMRLKLAYENAKTEKKD